MNVSDMITEIQEHGFEDVSSTRIVAAINDAYHDLCSRFSWPWLETVQTATATPGTQALTLATPIRKVQKLVDTTNDVRLYYSTMSDLVDVVDNVNDTTDTGVPTNFFIYDNIVHLWPIPATALNYRVWGIVETTDLTSGTLSAAILIPAKHHRALITGAISRLAPLNDDLGMAQYFQGQFEQRIETMRADSFDLSSDRPQVISNVYDD